MPEIPASDRELNVLFLCTGNSARSVMGEAILNRLGKGLFKAWSAGSSPAGTINAPVERLLKRLNYVIGGLRSKSWDEFEGEDAPQMDFVFTVCDRAKEESCPVWPGQPITAHWPFPDPAEFSGTEAEIDLAVAGVYRMIERRIDIFVNLPINSLDRMSLQKRLDEIGGAVTTATAGA